MIITAKIRNSEKENKVTVSSNGNSRELNIPAKNEGQGSSVNGGELLFTALATCFCNDIYREAVKRKMNVVAVECNVSGEFGNEGEAGSNIMYTVNVTAPEHSQDDIADLIRYVDQIAEIHNTLRKGTAVSLII